MVEITIHINGVSLIAVINDDLLYRDVESMVGIIDAIIFYYF